MRFYEYLIVFFMGFLSCALLYSIYFYSTIEFPIGPNSRTIDTPKDRIAEQDIIVLEDRIILMIPSASLSRYSDSGSMRPILDKGNNGIRIKPKGPEDITVGDIISFRKAGRLIVHRVIEKSLDEQGIYFITAGDNNMYRDGKVRFEEIEYITIAILY